MPTMSIRASRPLLWVPTPLALSLLPLLGFGACASPSGTPEVPVARLASFERSPHDYEASISNAVWSPQLEDFQPDKGDLSGAHFVHLRVHTAIMTNEEIEGLVGAKHYGSWTMRGSRSSAEAAFQRLEGSDERLVTVRPGQVGASTVISQSAFIERFEITSTPERMMVDPVIGVASEGLMLRLKGTPRKGSDALQVEATVEHHTLAQPIPTLEVQLPQNLMPVSIQQPVTTHQVLRFAETLGPRDAIVGGLPLTGDPLRMHVFIVTADLRDVAGKRVETTM